MKCFFTILILLFPLSLFAQEHLVFRGLPIDGNASDFVGALKSQGFKVKSQTEGEIMLKGPYAGVEKCPIAVHYSPLTGTVCKVTVRSPKPYKSWPSIKGRYDTLVEAFSQKYTLTKNQHLLFNPFRSSEFSALADKEDAVYSRYESKEGTILLKIEAVSSLKGTIVVIYEDKVNMNLYLTERNNAIISDI